MSDAVKEFVGLEGGLFVGEVEVAVGQRAGPAGGDDGEFGVVGEERGWRVGGGLRH